MSQPVIELKEISKDYYGNQVLKGVSLKVQPGEIHGLVGENGAGKSTLMNILFGMAVIHSTGGYSGEIVYDGQAVQMLSPKEAMDMGIGMVHQEFMLLPGFTVTENLKLNREITKHNVVSRILGEKLKSLDMQAMRADARAALDTLGVAIKETLVVEGLPVGHKQFIEIAREIDKSDMKLLVFDEPTAVLTEIEADQLLKAIVELAQRGIAILFITHRLDEVLQVADNISILRDGEIVGRLSGAEASIETMARLMVGRAVERVQKEAKAQPGGEQTAILQIEDLAVNMPGEQVKGVSLKVQPGEILGIGGLAGHGKLGIANGVMGLFPASGRVLFQGSPVKLGDPASALSQGLAFVSEDRREVGLLLDESIEDNIVLTSMQVKERFLQRILGLKFLDRPAVRTHAQKVIADLDIRCIGPQQLTRRLSGGNQQKVCIAKALALDPQLLFVSEPTRGVDVGAKKIILDLLLELNAQGMTIVITSSELGELRSVADRIAIIYDGRLEGYLPPDADDTDFGLMMAGRFEAARGVL